jgi:glycosyltransferase involved in cell wall biosynthesis
MFDARTVVASSVGGADEMVVERVTGLLVEPRDRIHTRDAVGDLLVDPFRLEAYGLAGRERALAVYHPQMLAAQLLAVHEAIVHGVPALVDLTDGGGYATVATGAGGTVDTPVRRTVRSTGIGARTGESVPA